MGEPERNAPHAALIPPLPVTLPFPVKRKLLHPKPIHLHRLVRADAGLLTRDAHLRLHIVHALDVGQQQPTPAAALDDDAVTLRIELRRGVDGFGRVEHADIDLQVVQLARGHRLEAPVARGCRDRVVDDLLRQRWLGGADGADAAAQIVRARGVQRDEHARRFALDRRRRLARVKLAMISHERLDRGARKLDKRVVRRFRVGHGLPPLCG